MANFNAAFGIEMRVLFISRAYPPIQGGLENFNKALHDALKEKVLVDAIINHKGKKNLPFFLPFAATKGLLTATHYDMILLGDGVLAIVGWLIKLFHPSLPIGCVIAGLDVTYPNRLYQAFWLRRFLPKIDKVFAISRATAEAARQRGIQESKITVIPCGINWDVPDDTRNKSGLKKHLPIEVEGKFVLLTVGRLVKRKGVSWFIKNVMPSIRDYCVYVVAGDGPERSTIEEAIRQQNLQDSVCCIGAVSEEMKTMLLSNADLFLQPNIKVTGDMEGFGIAVLEANRHGLPVLGSRIEGLQDSIIEGQNGWLIEPEDGRAYANRIATLSKQSSDMRREAGTRAKEFCFQNFSWEKVAQRYVDELRMI